MTYHPYDTQYNLARQGDSRAAGHYMFNHEAARRRRAIEELANRPVNLAGCHPQDTYQILARQGDARAAGHPELNRERFIALQRAEGK